jgi:hypothetical protein
MVESEPGAPTGACRLQHRWVEPGTPAPEQLPVETAPTRLSSASDAPDEVLPKPTIVPALPRGGLAVVLIAEGRMERTGPRSVSSAASPETPNAYPGSTRMLSTKSGRATC